MIFYAKINRLWTKFGHARYCFAENREISILLKIYASVHFTQDINFYISRGKTCCYIRQRSERLKQNEYALTLSLPTIMHYIRCEIRGAVLHAKISSREFSFSYIVTIDIHYLETLLYCHMSLYIIYASFTRIRLK